MDREDALRQVTAVCGAARLAFGASAVSVATVEPDGLRYVAASGVGAAEIVGTLLPLERGLAGYVALSGRSMAVDRPADDPRFAADVAERTGLIPSSMLLVPVHGDVGDVMAVLSVLDRAAGAADALQTATAFAELLATILPGIVAALASDPDADAAGAAAAETLRRLRSLDPEVGHRAVRLIDDLLDVLTSKRRR
jgi:hypothetical protein